MRTQKQWQVLQKLGVLCAYCMVYGLSWGAVAQAQSQQQVIANKRTRVDLTRRGRTRNRRGKGSKGSCEGAIDPQEFIGLMPPANPIMTTQASPIFWLYIPYPLNDPFALQLDIWDSEGKRVYESEVVDIEQSPGIVGLVPSEIALQTDQIYDWSITVLCEDPQTVAIPGSYKKIRVQEKLQKMPVDTDTWYDQLTATGRQRCTNPQNPQLTAVWTTLLSDPDAELNLAEVPFVGCLPMMSKPRS